MPVSLLDLKKQNEEIQAELFAAFKRVMDSGHFILGPEVDAFEKKTAAYVGARHAIAVSSGTDAILLALMALGIGPGDEVICPSFTFFATAGCIARTGALPVFVDSCPCCFNLDVEQVKANVTPKTKAIIPVHLFGQAADIEGLVRFANERGIPVIEDAAQSLGADLNGKRAGTIGTFGTYSFFPSKNLGGFGDAGLLVTNDDAHADKARLLRTHGSRPKYFHKLVGGNFRIDALQAALLSVKMDHLEEYSTARRRNADQYQNLLSGKPGIFVPTAGTSCGHGVNPGDAKIILPVEHQGRRHIWNQFTLRVPGSSAGGKPNRDLFRDFLNTRGIGSEIYYPLSMHQQECFQYAAKGKGPLPVCEQLSLEAVSIPVYPELRAAEIEEVAAAVSEFAAGAGGQAK